MVRLYFSTGGRPRKRGIPGRVISGCICTGGIDRYSAKQGGTGPHIQNIEIIVKLFVNLLIETKKMV